MKIELPDFSLVCLIGPSGSGKSTLAAQLFKDTEVISSDRCRARVTDDESALDANEDAFDLLQHTAALRLKRRLLTVIDATSVQKADRAHLVKLAREYHALPVAFVLDIDPDICESRNSERVDRQVKSSVAKRQSRSLRKGLRGLQHEGFRQVHTIRSPADIDAIELTRVPLWVDQRQDHGPFDIIGDVHGCFDELTQLLDTLGYQIDSFEPNAETLIHAHHPAGRQAFFVGDLTDRGPRNVDCLRLVMGMCEGGSARCCGEP